MSLDVSRSFRNSIMEQYPVLFTGKGRPLLKLIEYARTTDNFREGSSAPIVSEEKLRTFEALPDNTRPYAEEFIKYAQSILPKMRFSGYGRDLRSRVLINDGIRLETKAERFDQDRVDWVTGKRLSMLQVEKSRPRPSSIFEAQQELMAYLNRPCRHAWAKAKKRYWDDGGERIWEILQTISDTKPIPDWQLSLSPRDIADRRLRSIEHDFQPIYGPARTTTRQVNTHRLFSQNNGWSFLWRDLTAYIMQDYVTVDLKAAHLAIAARDWNIPTLLSIMKDHTKNVWDELKRETGIDDKNLVKGLTYAVVYGGGEGELIRTIRKHNRDLDCSTLRKQFNQSSIVRSLKVGAQVAQIRVKERGGINDAFGAWHPLSEDRDAKSLLALRSQSFEMAILLPALDVVRDRDSNVRIVLWMHDGCTIWGRVEKQLERDVKAIQEVVNEEAKKLGIPTRLEVK
jgi:hypothetical protein